MAGRDDQPFLFLFFILWPKAGLLEERGRPRPYQ